MAGKPKNFQAISNVLASYNFVDIASGTGYINFYAGTTVDKNLLSNFLYYSDVLYTQGGTTSSGTWQKIIDIDFDVLINRPMILQGLGIVNIPVYHNSVGSNYVIVTLKKWNGSTETDIVTNQSKSYGGGIFYTTLAVDLDVPKTLFKIGETLRLTVEGWGYEDEAGSNTTQIAHDPIGRTTDGILTFDASGAVSTRLQFQCPVRLSL